MSTRATIKFMAENETYYVYRHCDGTPDNILRDIDETIDKTSGRWTPPELGLFVASFLCYSNDMIFRVPFYEMTQSFHGDESYKYYVKWSGKSWEVEVE